MDCSMPGFPVLHYLLEFSQTHIHWVSDASQLSHPLSPPSPAFNYSQHQGPFQWISSLHQEAQSIGASTSGTVLPMNIQGWFPLELTGLISLLFKGLSRVFSSTRVQRHHSSALRLLYGPTLTSSIYNYWETHRLNYTDFFHQSDVFVFNIPPRFFIAFLPTSNRLLISWLQSLSTVNLEPKKTKSVNASTFLTFYSPWSDGTRCHDLIFFFLYWVLSWLFHSLSPSSRGPLVPLYCLPLQWYHLYIWGCWHFSGQSWLQFVTHRPDNSHNMLSM